MQCYDCGAMLRYTEKKYVSSTYQNRERITQYRCHGCYYALKEKVVEMFQGTKDRVMKD